MTKEPGQIAYEARFPDEDRTKKYAPQWVKLGAAEKAVWARVERAVAAATREAAAQSLHAWSSLPRDMYVVEARQIDAIVYEARLYSVPMVMAPEVRYVRADLVPAQDSIVALAEALVAHNDLLRSAFQAAQRDAIHDVDGTTNYRLLADRALEVLRKFHEVTNQARVAVAAKSDPPP